MSEIEKALIERVRELRRRHFGPRGKAAFAEKLGISLADYERIERGSLPAGDLMVRMCEATGEDLQWLLTGVESRGAVVITGARNRHQHLLTRMAAALDETPEIAHQLEAFLGLLLEGQAARGRLALAPAPESTELIPIVDWRDVADLNAPTQALAKQSGPAPLAPGGGLTRRRGVQLLSPDAGRAVESGPAEIVAIRDESGAEAEYLRCPRISTLLPNAVAIRTPIESEVGSERGEAIVVVSNDAPAPGATVLCRLREGGARLRVWLGENDGNARLGRLGDEAVEIEPKTGLAWCAEVLFQVTAAA
ncbi:MAG: helix-turn-helix transcriptional regulator [Phycisphaerales bacterium]|nr:helix-turn-helix transcriptional regulator [Phycisphaerales bacterium]